MCQVQGSEGDIFSAFTAQGRAPLLTCIHVAAPLQQVPDVIASAMSKFLGPLLVDPRSSGPSIIMTAAAGAAPGPPGRAAGGGFGEGFYDGLEAAGRGAGAAVRHRQPGAVGASAAGAGAAAAELPAPSPEALQALLAMGFSQQQAAQALQQAGNDLQTAIALLVG